MRNSLIIVAGIIIMVLSVTVVPYLGFKFIDSDLHFGAIGNYQDGTDVFMVIISCVILASVGLAMSMKTLNSGTNGITHQEKSNGN